MAASGAILAWVGTPFLLPSFPFVYSVYSMKRLLLLLFAAALPVCAAPSTTVPNDQNFRRQPLYQVYFADYLAAKRGHPVDLIFVGDSITEHWRWGPGLPVWLREFENRAFNFGLSADRTEQALWRLQNFDLSGFAPQVAVVLIGTNNIYDPPEDIAAGVKAVVEATRAKFPGVRVVLTSILPKMRGWDKMKAVNALLAPLADGKTVFYCDLAAKFTWENDRWKGLVPDGLHLSTDGYELWATELKALLPVVLK